MNFNEKNLVIHEVYQQTKVGQSISNDLTKFFEDFFNEHHTRSYNLKAQYFYCDKTDGVYGGKNLFMRGYCDEKFNPKKLISLTNVRKDPTKGRQEIVLQRTKQAMRDAISEQHQACRKYLINTQTNCAICNADLTPLPSIEIHLDHCGEDEYRHIVEEFLSVGPNLQLVDLDPNWGLVSNEDKQMWIDFHFEKANYQLLCRTCNCSKEKK